MNRLLFSIRSSFSKRLSDMLIVRRFISISHWRYLYAGSYLCMQTS